MQGKRDILRRVSALVKECLELEELELTPRTTAADVPGWDSVSNVQILVAIEEEFGIRIHTGEMASIRDAGDLVQVIAQRSGGAEEQGW